MMGSESLEGGENAAFWLPTHFLTDDDFLFSDHKKPTKPLLYNNNNTTKCIHVFNNPPGFGSDPFQDSSLSTPETKTENNDDTEFLSELTRHFSRSSLNNHNNEKGWMISTSPQSTLTGFGPWTSRSGFSSNGSPNGPSSRVPSPPLTPELKNDAAWDLLYEAAGQVALLKMNAISAHINNQTNRGLLTAPRHSNQYEQQVKWGQENYQERENNSWYCPHHQYHHNDYNHQQRRSCGGAMTVPQCTAWPSLTQTHHHRQGNNSGMYFNNGSGARGGGVAVKRQSAGTGVFLPRRVSTTPPRQRYNSTIEPRKKPSGCPTVILPARVVQALNLDPDDSTTNRYSRFPSDHDILVARRNAMVGQQRGSMRNENTGTAMVGQAREILLPSDWTY